MPPTKTERRQDRQKGHQTMSTPTETEITPTETEQPTQPQDGETPATNDPAAPDAKDADADADDSEAKRPAMHLTTTKALRDAVEAKVKAEDIPMAGIVRKALYAYVGIEMPADELTAGTKRKYANEEERKKATSERNEELKALLELSKLARSKGLNLTDMLTAQLKGEGEAAAA
jgi:hypothetical protein